MGISPARPVLAPATKLTGSERLLFQAAGAKAEEIYL